MIAAAAALALSSPLLIIIVGTIWITMGAPVFFRQARAGLRGRQFVMWKFRTMRPSELGEEELQSDDARLTRLGAFLRSTSLDELPSLWNVLRGDMTLVGPRPLLVRYLGRYTPEQARRHDVRPGITGWAQVNGRNAISWDEKFRLDVWYVDNRSVFLDVRILILTLFQASRRSGISADDRATMPEFLGSDSKKGRAP